MKERANIQPEQFAGYWWVALIVGSVLAVAGVWLAFGSVNTGSLVLHLLGIFWLITGAFDIADALFVHLRKRRMVNLLMGAFSLFLGVMAFRESLLSAVMGWEGLVTVIGVLALLMGVIQFVQARRGLRRYWFIGVLNAILGLGLLLFRQSVGALLVFVVVAGLVVGGAVLVWYGFWLRRYQPPTGRAVGAAEAFPLASESNKQPPAS